MLMVDLLHKLRILGYRENRLAKAIGVGFVGRGVGVAAQFVATRVLVAYLNGQQGYGIFVTILSVIGWVQLVNFGLGLGFQNTLIDAVAQKDGDRTTGLISTTQIALAAVCLLAAALWTLLWAIGFPDWARFLNAASSPYAPQVALSVYVAGIVGLGIVFTSYIGPIYAANQELHRAGFWGVGAQLLGLALLVAATHLRASLPVIILCFNGAQVAVGILNGFWLIGRNARLYLPRLRHFSLRHLKAVTGVGSAFFLIQLTGLLQYNLDSIIISRTLGPAEVAPYSVVMRLFTVFITGSGIVFVPLWSAFGNAISSNDWEWVKRRYSQMRATMLLLYLAFWGLAVAFGQSLIRLWVGPKIEVPLLLVVLVGFLQCSRVWLDIHSIMCNALNVVKTQAALGIPVGLVQVAIMYFSALHWGIYGMVVGLAISQFATGGWVLPLLARREMRKRYARFVDSAHNL